MKQVLDAVNDNRASRPIKRDAVASVDDGLCDQEIDVERTALDHNNFLAKWRED